MLRQRDGARHSLGDARHHGQARSEAAVGARACRIERARKEGKRLGRPTGHGKKVAKVYDKIVAALQAPGRTEGVRVIAKRFGVDPATVQSISKEIGPFEAGATI